MSKSRGFTTHQSKTPVRGFTLIELLITISIIAILTAIGLVAYSYVLKQGKDSKRQADLRTIQSALEQYYADHQTYPIPSGCIDYCWRTSNQGESWIPGLVPTYVKSLPLDPINSGTLYMSSSSYTYAYVTGPSLAGGPPGANYVLLVRLENSENPIAFPNKLYYWPGNGALLDSNFPAGGVIMILGP